jgi:hypothetical protein
MHWEHYRLWFFEEDIIPTTAYTDLETKEIGHNKIPITSQQGMSVLS